MAKKKILYISDVKEEKLTNEAIAITDEKIKAYSTESKEAPKKKLPDNYIVGRNYITQASTIEGDLFSLITPKDGKGNTIKEQATNYIVSGIPRSISEIDITSFFFAMQQILYNQSYLAGKIELNKETGDIERFTGISKYPPKERNLHSGEIVASLSEICKFAYGTNSPTNTQKKTMRALIDTLDKTEISITYPDGTVVERKICVKMNTVKKENGSTFYDLFLNPILTVTTKGWAELPQNTMFKLTEAIKARNEKEGNNKVNIKKTASHLKLIRLLAIQDKRKPFVRALDLLLQDLGLWDSYKAQRKRTLAKLESIFPIMLDIGIIKELPKIGTGTNGIITYTFVLDPNFTKHIGETPKD